MPPSFRNSKTVIRESKKAGLHADMTPRAKKQAEAQREERRAQIAYLIEERMRERLGPMEPVRKS